jgi:hypothetical protein
MEAGMALTLRDDSFMIPQDPDNSSEGLERLA